MENRKFLKYVFLEGLFVVVLCLLMFFLTK